MRHWRLAIRRLWRSEKGTALIETAVVVPVAIILLVGLIDFGRAYFTKATAEKATRNAVRYLTTLPPASICGWGLTRAKNLALYGDITSAGKTPLVDGWTSGQITLKTPDCSTAVTSASIIEIDADVPFSPLVWPAIGLPSTMTLKVDYQARWIGE